DRTDRLVPCDVNPDLGGPNSGVIWTGDDAGTSYNVGVFYDSTIRPVISVSFEFGGYGGDQNALAALYIAALSGIGPKGDFVRGDINADGGTNIADAIYLLTALFAMGPPPRCSDAADTNDDGIVNIADAIYLLSALFVIGAPDVLPPNDNTGCGMDPTADMVDCVSFPQCP
ncbi:MAG: hypothetical protein V3T77_05745, partial [Planctomycetota bacterium]